MDRNRKDLIERFLIVLGAVLVLWGCDSEFERIRQRSEINERIRLQCIPTENERIIVAWSTDNPRKLLCWRYQPNKPTPKLDVNTVATSDELDGAGR